MKKIVYCLICLTFILLRPESPAWADWVQDGGSLNVTSDEDAASPSIAISSNGTPYVAWQEFDSSEWRTQIYVKHFAGSLWVPVGSGSLNVQSYQDAVASSISISNDGTPYVAWQEFDSMVEGCNQIYVKHFAGGAWVSDGSGSLNVNSDMDAASPSIAISSDGTPYVAWQEVDPVEWCNQIYVKHFAGGAWVSDGNSLNVASDKNAVSPSIAISNDGTPYVAWREVGSVFPFRNQIYVKHFAGGNWIWTGGSSLNAQSYQNAVSPSIAISNNGTPYTAWQEFDTTGAGCNQIYVKHFDSGAWVPDGGSLNYQTSRHAYHPSLAIANNTPYVTWQEDTGVSHQVHVKHYAAGSWVSLNGILNVNAGENAQMPEIAFLNSTPYVSWQEYSAVTGTDLVFASHYVPPTATSTITPTISPTPTQTLTYTITPTITPTATRCALEKHKVISYPSPARGKDLWFYYYVNGPSQIKIEVYNVLGELCRTLHDQSSAPGYCRTHWDIGQAAPGVYLYRLSLTTSQGVRKHDLRKLVIVK